MERSEKSKRLIIAIAQLPGENPRTAPTRHVATTRTTKKTNVVNRNHRTRPILTRETVSGFQMLDRTLRDKR